VDKIVEELLRLLTSFQYHAMMDLWGFLQERFFSRLQVHTLTQPRAPARPLAHTHTHRAHTSQNPKTETRNPKPETMNHKPTPSGDWQSSSRPTNTTPYAPNRYGLVV